jgi:two-component system, OmpR family, sensor histidine kinase ArlS
VTLLGKLTLTGTLSKITIVLFFIAVLPLLIDRVAFRSANTLLQKQEQKVLDNISKNGVDYYLQGDSSYGSYTLLKEEYISLEKVDTAFAVDTIQTSQRVIEGDTATYRILSRSFAYGNDTYGLEIGKSLSSISQYNSPLQRIALVVLGALIMLTLLTDLFFTRVLLRPLGTIIRTKVQQPVFPFKELPAAVATSTSDFKRLDQLLIDLMHRINEDFNRERQFTSNASHELMTPLGILQTKMENMLLRHDLEEGMQERIMDMMRTLQRLKKIVHSLLLIARVENAQYSRQDTIVPQEVVTEILEELQAVTEEKMIDVKMLLTENFRLSGVNADLVRQLLYNIIHNGIRYNNVGGDIFISDEIVQNNYNLEIRDSGIGMSPEETHLLFGRFRKKKNAGDEGYGLGLAIVKAIAEYHNIKIELSSSLGSGTRFKLRFP